MERQNVGSTFLSDLENERLFEWLGKGCHSFASGAVQLISAETCSPKQWTYKHTGIVSLVKDNSKRTHFLRLFDIDDGLLWEQRIYENLKMNQPIDELLTFEGDDKIYGLNFSSPEEASNFKICVEMKSVMQRPRRKTETGFVTSTKRQGNPASYGAAQAAVKTYTKKAEKYTKGVLTRIGSVRRSVRGKKLRPSISAPTNFQHKNQITLDANGMMIGSDDPLIAKFMELLGVTGSEEKQLVQEVIEKQGGIGLLHQELERKDCLISVDKGAPPPPPIQGLPHLSGEIKEVSNSKTDGRTNLLNEIHKSIVLKPVKTNALTPGLVQEKDTIAGAISRALNSRRNEMKGGQDTSDEDDVDSDTSDDFSD